MRRARRWAAVLLLISAACAGGRGVGTAGPPIPSATRVEVTADTLEAGGDVRPTRLWLLAGAAIVALVYVVVRALGDHSN